MGTPPVHEPRILTGSYAEKGFSAMSEDPCAKSPDARESA